MTGKPTDHAMLAVHNETAHKIVGDILQPVAAAGGDRALAMVVLESVIVGVIATIGDPGRDDDAVDMLAMDVKERLAEHRLAAMRPEGSA